MDKSDLRKILIFRHSIGNTKNFDVKKLIRDANEYEEEPRVVLKEESDANILQGYIAKELGLVTPYIYPRYNAENDKIIVTGEMELPKTNKYKVVFGNEYNSILSLKTFMELGDKFAENKSLNQVEEKIFSKTYSKGILEKNNEDKPVDEFLNSDYQGYFNSYFEKKAIRDIVKSRVARIATFDRSLTPSANLYCTDTKTHKVTNVFPVYNNIDRMTIYSQNCDKDTSKIVDKYQSEFSKKALPLKSLIKCIKENELVQEAFGKDGLKDLGEDLGKISTREYEKEYAESSSGYEICKHYSDFVNAKIVEVANELTK